MLFTFLAHPDLSVPNSDTGAMTMAIGGRGTLPIHVRQHTTKTRDSFASFNKKFTLPELIPNEEASSIGSSSSSRGTFAANRMDPSSSHASLESGAERRVSNGCAGEVWETSVSPAFPARAHGRENDNVSLRRACLSSMERYDVSLAQRNGQGVLDVIPTAPKSLLRRSL